MFNMSKEILMKVDSNRSDTTLREVLEMIKQLQAEHPDMNIFWDGDEYAICGRPKDDE